jgi:diguanylate cyclase (GGDEF)-like protein
MSNINSEISRANGTHKVSVQDLAQVQHYTSQRQSDIELVEIRLTQGLQRSLDIQTLLAFFCKEIAEIVPCDSVAYQNSEYRIAHIHGKVGTHMCQYHLELEGQFLGDLICTRNKPFGDLDLRTIESLAGTLVYPLRNALLYQQAISMSLEDPLTGVGNRKALENALNREINLSGRQGKPLTMLMIDIDHFKQINDTYGHDAGDQALSHVTEIISAVSRQSDEVFRYGGEEFIVLLNNTDKANANDLAERIRHAIEQSEVCLNHCQFNLTVSIGVAEHHSSKGKDMLFKEADKALYEAKHGGRNQVKVAA